MKRGLARHLFHQEINISFSYCWSLGFHWMLYYDDRSWHLSRHASSSPHVEINYDISASLGDIQTTALLATVLFYGIYHNQLQTRHQRLAILDTAGLHSGDGGDTFTLQLLWGSKCFVGLRYEYHPLYHFILRLKPVWNKVYLFSLGPIVFFETFLQCARFFRWILAPVSHFKLQLGRKCFGFSVGFLIPKTNVFFPRWLFPWPMSLLTFYPLFVLDSEWQERFVYLRPVEQQCLV